MSYLLAPYSFNCGLCDYQVSHKDPDVMVSQVEEEDNLLLGPVNTAKIGHKEDGVLHWNFVVLGKDGDFKGIKSTNEEISETLSYNQQKSYTLSNKTIDESEIDPSKANFQLFKKETEEYTASLINDTIIGKEVVIISRDPVLAEIIQSTLWYFAIDPKEVIIENKIRILSSDDAVSGENVTSFYSDTGTYSSSTDNVDPWVDNLLHRINGLDEYASKQVVETYIGSLRESYQKMLDHLGPYLTVSEACPVSDPGSTQQVTNFLNNIIPTKEFDNIKRVMTDQEFQMVLKCISNKFTQQF